MKKWHMEEIIGAVNRSARKLEIPAPGQRIWISGAARGRTLKGFFFSKMTRSEKGRRLSFTADA